MINILTYFKSNLIWTFTKNLKKKLESIDYQQKLNQSVDKINPKRIKEFDSDIKPIFTIGVPPRYSEQVNIDLAEYSSKMMPEYHTIVYQLYEGFDTKFEAFYPNNFDENTFNRLKQIILNKLQQDETK